MIEIAGLRKSYGKREILKGIDLSIKPSVVTGFAGPNACGKTTLMKCILGLAVPTSGTIKVNGFPVDAGGDFRRSIGYMPQNANFPENLTIKELLEMLADLREETSTRGEELISHFELEKFLDKPIGRLSGGTRQKVAATAAFLFDAPIILLDEPTAGMDPIVRLRFKNLLRNEAKKGKTIILVSHLMTEVEQLASEIAFLNEGKIIFDGAIDKLKFEAGNNELEAAITHLFERKREEAP